MLEEEFGDLLEIEFSRSLDQQPVTLLQLRRELFNQFLNCSIDRHAVRTHFPDALRHMLRILPDGDDGVDT